MMRLVKRQNNEAAAVAAAFCGGDGTSPRTKLPKT
jgi:hypothetical protein